MSEYIVDWDENLVIDTFSKNSLREEIVRCRVCKHFKYCQFHRHSKNKPNGFCAWSERRDA